MSSTSCWCFCREGGQPQKRREQGTTGHAEPLFPSTATALPTTAAWKAKISTRQKFKTTGQRVWVFLSLRIKKDAFAYFAIIEISMT